MSNLQLSIEALKVGAHVLLIDDAKDNAVGYIICPAVSITSEDVCFLVNHARGVICAALEEEHLLELQLPAMHASTSMYATDMAISIEAREGVTTGISAADRARTLRTLAKTTSPKLDLVSPGHIFPIRAKKGGVLVRSGIAEAAVDLLSLAEVPPIAAFCQCLSSDGELLLGDAVAKLADSLNIPYLTVSDIIRARLLQQPIIEEIAAAKLPTSLAGNFQVRCFRSTIDQAEHMALIKGSIDSMPEKPCLVRVQAENKIGDLLGTKYLQQRKQIRAALQKIENTGEGVFVYIRHPRERGILSGTPTRNDSREPYRQNIRQHGIGAQILSHLGVRNINLLTNSNKDISDVSAFGLTIVARIPLDNL